jgi:hypothetical protein
VVDATLVLHGRTAVTVWMAPPRPPATAQRRCGELVGEGRDVAKRLIDSIEEECLVSPSSPNRGEVVRSSHVRVIEPPPSISDAVPVTNEASSDAR